MDAVEQLGQLEVPTDLPPEIEEERTLHSVKYNGYS